MMARLVAKLADIYLDGGGRFTAERANSVARERRVEVRIGDCLRDRGHRAILTRALRDASSEIVAICPRQIQKKQETGRPAPCAIEEESTISVVVLVVLLRAMHEPVRVRLHFMTYVRMVVQILMKTRMFVHPPLVVDQ
jgi:hypothetical protein